MLSKLEWERRLPLVNAALKEFATKGFDDASTNVIAKEAKLSKALMFHYVKNKEELFLYLYNYCVNLIQKDYLNQMDEEEGDIFKRLEQSYLLQIDLLKRHPWIFEFNQLSALTKSVAINEKMRERRTEKKSLCFEQLFIGIDNSLFREGLNIQRCKELIFLGNVGFITEILGEIRQEKRDEVRFEAIVDKLNVYFSELKVIFYKSEGGDRVGNQRDTTSN